LEAFSRDPFAPGPAIAEYVQIQESSSLRTALTAMFRTAYDLADPELRERLARFQGRPVSSARHFETRLKGWFDSDAGFEVERSEVVTTWGLAPRVDVPFEYLSSSVGELRQLPYLPDTYLCPDAKLGTEEEALLELGVFAFVARRS